MKGKNIASILGRRALLWTVYSISRQIWLRGVENYSLYFRFLSNIQSYCKQSKIIKIYPKKQPWLLYQVHRGSGRGRRNPKIGKQTKFPAKVSKDENRYSLKMLLGILLSWIRNERSLGLVSYLVFSWVLGRVLGPSYFRIFLIFRSSSWSISLSLLVE